MADALGNWRRRLLRTAIASGILLMLAPTLMSAAGFTAFRIPVASMRPTLEVGDHIRARRVSDPASVRQGDIVVFDYPRNLQLDYIKRCVAVAGDTVAVREGVLYVNGRIYESNFGARDGDHSCVPTANRTDCPEPHSLLDPAALSRHREARDWPLPGTPEPFVVPTGHVFVMGDNRYDSMDSRHFGPLPVHLIHHRASFITWSRGPGSPLPRWSRLGKPVH